MGGKVRFPSKRDCSKSDCLISYLLEQDRVDFGLFMETSSLTWILLNLGCFNENSNQFYTQRF